MNVAVCFTNFGPYHLARIRALASRLAERGDRLIAYEVAGAERRYPWDRVQSHEEFEWITLFPDRELETLERSACVHAMIEALERDRPEAVAVAGYSRPESMAAARWTKANGRIAILMSESQAIDRPRAWWKELIKGRRVRLFDRALVGGERHAEYLIDLGMRPDRITLGYNAVDNAAYAERARACRESEDGRVGMPDAPFFLCVCRFVADKNLERLIAAYSRYRRQTAPGEGWDLVLCGGGPGADKISRAIDASGLGAVIHRPGFIQADGLSRYYAHASVFILPSVVEPWGLVVNEAAACGLPLLVSKRAGCALTLVPDPAGMTGMTFDPFDIEEMATQLSWMAARSCSERVLMGQRAAELVAEWGPDRFATGFIGTLDMGPLRDARIHRRSVLMAGGK